METDLEMSFYLLRGRDWRDPSEKKTDGFSEKKLSSLWLAISGLSDGSFVTQHGIENETIIVLS